MKKTRSCWLQKPVVQDSLSPLPDPSPPQVHGCEVQDVAPAQLGVLAPFVNQKNHKSNPGCSAPWAGKIKAVEDPFLEKGLVAKI